MRSPIHIQFHVYILLLSVVLLAACLPTQPEAQDESLVTGQGCAPPCWYGAVPEETTIEEGESILRQLSFVDSTTINRRTLEFNELSYDLRSWQYRGAADTRHGGTMAFVRGVLRYIDVFLPQKLNLGDVVTQQGEPEFVDVVRHSGGGVYIYFYYPKKGLLVVAEPPPDEEGAERKLWLSPQIPIFMARYSRSTMSMKDYYEQGGYSSREAEAKAYSLIPWPGLNRELPFPR